MKKICKHIYAYGFLYLWIVAVGFIVFAYQTDESPESAHYANDTPTTVLVTVGIMLVELVVLYLLLKPWQRPRSVWGSLIALFLFTPWTFLSTVVAMHGPLSMAFHGLWLWIVGVLLLLNTIFVFIYSQLIPLIRSRKNSINS